MLRPDLSARVQNGPWTSQKAANISALLLYSHTITIRHNTLGYGENTSYSAPSTQLSQSKPASAIPPLPPMPPSFNPSPAILKETYAAVVGIKLQQLVDLFTPCYMFFYSSLMDAEVL